MLHIIHNSFFCLNFIYISFPRNLLKYSIRVALYFELINNLLLNVEQFKIIYQIMPFFAMVSKKISSHFLETRQFTFDKLYNNQNINLHLASVANSGIWLLSSCTYLSLGHSVIGLVYVYLLSDVCLPTGQFTIILLNGWYVLYSLLVSSLSAACMLSICLISVSLRFVWLLFLLLVCFLSAC